MQMKQWPDVNSWAEVRQWPDVKSWAEHTQWPDVKSWTEHTQWPEMNWSKKPQWPQKKRWSDFSTMQRICVIVMGVLQVGLLAAGLWDLAHRKPEEVRGDKRFWWGLMFVNWIGPIAYFTYGRKSSPFPTKAVEQGEPAGHLDGTEETSEFAGPTVI